VSRVLVGTVQTVVVAVADVDPRYAVAVVAREQVAETRAALRLAVLRRLVRPVAAVVVAVAVPRGRYAPVVGAPEAVRRARPLRTVHRVLVAVVAAVVVAVAQPIRFHAYVRLLALQMVRGARDVLRAPVVRLVRSRVVLAVVHAVAHLKPVPRYNDGVRSAVLHSIRRRRSSPFTVPDGGRANDHARGTRV